MSAIARIDPIERPNAPLFPSASRAGHVESYFLRANDPDEPRAIWLKATVYMPRDGAATADVWCIVFDGVARRTWTHRESVPLVQAVFESTDPLSVRVQSANCAFALGREGHARARMKNDTGPCAWDLTWLPEGAALDGPFNLFARPALVRGPFPRSKVLTPCPALRLSGRIECFGEVFELRNWPGMQGHNWGREHAWEYVWGQCPFPDASGAIHCLVEGFSARIRAAGIVSPRFSALVVRRGEREYRFDGLFDWWRQDAAIDDMTWTLRLRSRAGEARLSMTADPELMACLGYLNPDGRLSYCLNSKLASVHLQVNPINEDGFECHSAHGGALEFLRHEPDPRIDGVV